MLSLRLLTFGLLLVCSLRPADAGPNDAKRNQGSLYVFPRSDFRKPSKTSHHSPPHSLGTIAGYAVETHLVYGKDVEHRRLWSVVVSTASSKTPIEGGFEVTAAAICKGNFMTEVKTIQPRMPRRFVMIAQCIGDPISFALQSIRFIPRKDTFFREDEDLNRSPRSLARI